MLVEKLKNAFSKVVLNEDHDLLKKQERRAFFALEQLGEIQDVVRSLPPSLQSAEVTYRRLLYSVFADLACTEAIAETFASYKQRGKLPFMALSDSVDRGYGYLLARSAGYTRRETRLVHDFFSHLLAAADKDLGEVLKEIYPDINEENFAVVANSLFRMIAQTDPDNSPVELEYNTDFRITEIHVDRVSTDSRIQAVRLWKGMQEARSRRLFSRSTAVVGMSWLIEPSMEKVLGRMGMGRDQGVKYFYPSIEDISTSLDYHVPAPFSQHVTGDKIMAVAVRNIVASPANLRTFVMEGKLPNVGMVSIPPHVFATQ